MKLDKLVGERFKERPADCVIDSHALMTRGGYIKYVASGIYSSYAVLRRITRKIEQIVREEMDRIDGQEVVFPVAMPASLLRESGRYESIGDELLRFQDRNGAQMVLGMTHEEAAVQLVREYGQSYAKYPFMIYQIQTKFRDEQRPRGGLIRVREFIMKDAYSFHVSRHDLEAYYERCLKAYERIFVRVGIPETISVASDSGMMGGNASHEFMLLTPVGEDSIVICDSCGYKANLEAAECVVADEDNGERECERERERERERECERGEGQAEPLMKVHTPGMKTMRDVCDYLGVELKNSCKAVVYQKEPAGSFQKEPSGGYQKGSVSGDQKRAASGDQKGSACEYVVVFLRGDLDVNETKVKNFIGANIYPADISEGAGCAGDHADIIINDHSGGFDGDHSSGNCSNRASDFTVDHTGSLANAHAVGLAEGFIGPYGLSGVNIAALYDNSLKDAHSLCCGANEADYHYTGFNSARDLPNAEYHDFAKVAGGGICACPKCKSRALKISRGIEVGNIFQLGTKYTESMDMRYMDENGDSRYPVMGCYGIGIGRLAAAVCEARHDDNGPVWPMPIAPWQVHLCCLRADDAGVRAVSDSLYAAMRDAHIEIIYDDRVASAGVMFSDADLIGAPIRVIVSPRNLKEGLCEITSRDKSLSIKVPTGDVVAKVKELCI